MPVFKIFSSVCKPFTHVYSFSLVIITYVSVDLVYFVYFVDLVCLVYLVYFVYLVYLVYFVE